MLLSDGSDGNLDPSLVCAASAPAARFSTTECLTLGTATCWSDTREPGLSQRWLCWPSFSAPQSWSPN